MIPVLFCLLSEQSSNNYSQQEVKIKSAEKLGAGSPSKAGSPEARDSWVTARFFWRDIVWTVAGPRFQWGRVLVPGSESKSQSFQTLYFFYLLPSNITMADAKPIGEAQYSTIPR